MRCYISRPVFYLVLVLIFLLPLSKKAGLLLFGERAKGTVTDYGIIEHKSTKYPGDSNVSIISFSINGYIYKTTSALNVVYDLGETLTVIYDKKDPRNNTLLTFSSIYSGYGLILAGFVMMLWMAFYTTFCTSKRKVLSDMIKPGDRKLLE